MLSCPLTHTYIELSSKQVELREKLEQLTLDKDEIWKRENADGPTDAPWVIKVPYLVLCWMLDAVFEGEYVPSRFFLLETVARMPYFSYIGMLHFYETLGFWRRSADMKRIHFAEEMNEFRHLMIMESMGGDQRWWVRFMAQHAAIAYFIGLCFLWALSPSLSYKFSEMLETHAVNTYGQFLDENEELLKDLPPSLAAVDYYALGASDPYFAEFQTTAISNGWEVSVFCGAGPLCMCVISSPPRSDIFSCLSLS
jgi:ubiquinol oxidase